MTLSKDSTGLPLHTRVTTKLRVQVGPWINVTCEVCLKFAYKLVTAGYRETSIFERVETVSVIDTDTHTGRI